MNKSISSKDSVFAKAEGESRLKLFFEQIQRYFIDREHILRILNRELFNLISQKSYKKAVSIVGIGGIGKTWLLYKFIFENADVKVPMIIINLDKYDINSIDEALRLIALELEKFGGKAITFDILRGIYIKRLRGYEKAIVIPKTFFRFNLCCI